jgi:hypothetical protein
MRVQIFAGRVESQMMGDKDYAWLTKEEIKNCVSLDYYTSTADMLTEQ